MASTKAEKILYVILNVTIAAAIVGVGLLLWTSESTEIAVFEILAFSVSVSALTLAVLSGISSIRQMRMMQKVSREVHAALAEIREVNLDNETIKDKLSQEYAVTQSIIDALNDSGIGDSEADRETIAGHIEKTLRTKVK